MKLRMSERWVYVLEIYFHEIRPREDKFRRGRESLYWTYLKRPSPGTGKILCTLVKCRLRVLEQ